MKLRSGKVIESGSGSVGVMQLPTVPLSSFLQPDNAKSSIIKHGKGGTEEDYNPYQNYPVLSPSQVKQEEED